MNIDYEIHERLKEVISRLDMLISIQKPNTIVPSVISNSTAKRLEVQGYANTESLPMPKKKKK